MARVPKGARDHSGWDEFLLAALSENEERLRELEAAHAALALRLVKLIADLVGMSDDATITAFLLAHAEEVRQQNLRMGQWDWKSRLVRRVEDAGRHLHPMPRPLGRDFGRPPRRATG